MKRIKRNIIVAPTDNTPNDEDIVNDGCIEILIASGTESESRVGDVSQSSVLNMQSSMVREVIGAAKDEHSYAYTQRRRAFDGKEKDHCYTSRSTEGVDPDTKPKTRVDKEHSYSTRYALYRSMQPGSDEDISHNTDDSMLGKDRYYYPLPHYQSSDSALDVTGFDSISEKCLSSENLNVKTVDVFTDRCILQGKSDPDISKMTLSASADFDKSLSLPSSPAMRDIEERMILDHTYSAFSKGFGREKLVYYWSPLQDHCYDTTLKRMTPVLVGSLKRGRSIDNMNTLPKYTPSQMSASAFMKSPFLDHTYQSVEMNHKKSGENPSCFQTRYKNDKQSKGRIHSYDVGDVKRTYLDHTYEKKGSISTTDNPKTSTSITRFRSNSLTERFPKRLSDVNSDQVEMDSDDNSSDSGTESLKGDNTTEIPMITEQSYGCLQNDDHSYVYKTTAL